MQQLIAKPDQVFMQLMVSNGITTKWERKKISPLSYELNHTNPDHS